MTATLLNDLNASVADQATLDNALEHFRTLKIRLPRLSALADPHRDLNDGIELDTVDPDTADNRNLFRLHWFNAADRIGRADVPGHIVIPPELTGSEAKIIVVLGDRFPMIRAHKVLAAYGCLIPKLLTGRFDPGRHRAVWPSTGNYCRGGVAISRILKCRGVAVLPEGMSQERFDWLHKWVTDPADIIRTPGTESNVKEIYDACAELARDPRNVILNQFSDFGNYLAHFLVTGPALAATFEAVRGTGDLNLAAFVAGTGSAGTLAAGDHLKDRFGSRTCAVEALECPTMLYNGYGEHNIQGIGDKHIPLIHNVMNTDFVTAVSDVGPDMLNLLFNTDAGRTYLAGRRAIPEAVIGDLKHLGLSSIANVLAAAKLATHLNLGPNDAVITIATDGAQLYETELEKAATKYFNGKFDELAAAETYGRIILGLATEHLIELDRTDRDRIFNLGYFTWVEQQGIALDDFEARRNPRFWSGLIDGAADLDDRIDDFNRKTGWN